MEDQDPKKKLDLSRIEEINNLETARMTLRWTLERLHSLEKQIDELTAKSERDAKDKIQPSKTAEQRLESRLQKFGFRIDRLEEGLAALREDVFRTLDAGASKTQRMILEMEEGYCSRAKETTDWVWDLWKKLKQSADAATTSSDRLELMEAQLKDLARSMTEALRQPAELSQQWRRRLAEQDEELRSLSEQTLARLEADLKKLRDRAAEHGPEPPPPTEAPGKS